MPTIHTAETIRTLLLKCLEAADPAPPAPPAADTSLLGKDSHFDSLGLVSFIVDVEQALDDELGIAVTLADERAMSQKRSPFRTVQTLTDYIVTLMTDAAGAAQP